ncbi:MAG: VOC family protein [Flavobacteriaceae bacterium]|nr:VOC family protein [Flavobacteriaceae bacterium]
MDDSKLAFKALTTILVVSDLQRSKSFYVDILGASLFREYGGNSAVLEFLGNWILLVTPGGPTEDKPGTYFTTPAKPENVSHCFTLRVDNCQKSYEILKSNGAEFLTPPLDRGSETRCFFRDPDGHLFEISEFRK